jgi:hypothetical protein
MLNLKLSVLVIQDTELPIKSFLLLLLTPAALDLDIGIGSCFEIVISSGLLIH